MDLRCAIKDCDGEATRLGLCGRHYKWWKRKGTFAPERRRLDGATTADRLERYVDRSGGPDACWPWTRARNKLGYGAMSRGNASRRMIPAHRAAYEEAHHVTLDPSVDVMHLCNNPPCCNPAHLRAGTRAKNQQYMAASGRSARGQRNGQAKLSDTDAAHLRALRAEDWKLAALAERFGVSQAQVSRICNGRQRAQSSSSSS